MRLVFITKCGQTELNITRLVRAESYLLVTHKDDGDIGAEVLDLGCPLLGDVLQAVRRVYTKAHQNDVGVGVRQGTQSVVVLLAGGIPQCQLNLARGQSVNEGILS